MPSAFERFLEASQQTYQPVFDRYARGGQWSPKDAWTMVQSADEGADAAVWNPLAEKAGEMSVKAKNPYIQALLGGGGAGAAMLGSVFLNPSNWFPGPADDALKAFKMASPKQKRVMLWLDRLGNAQGKLDEVERAIGPAVTEGGAAFHPRYQELRDAEKAVGKEYSYGPRTIDRFQMDELPVGNIGKQKNTELLKNLKSDYSSVPDPLMGINLENNRLFQNAAETQGFKHKQPVLVILDDGSIFSDYMYGLNPSHAVERAKRNWPNSQIIPYAE